MERVCCYISVQFVPMKQAKLHGSSASFFMVIFCFRCHCLFRVVSYMASVPSETWFSSKGSDGWDLGLLMIREYP